MFRLFGTIWALIGAAVALVSAAVAITLNAAPVWNATAIGAVTCVIALGLLLIGRKLRSEAVEVYRSGVEVDAEIVAVAIDHRVRVNQKSPWRVTYRFDVNGEAYEGAYACWTDAKPEIEPGARVLVLHDAKRPSRSVLWTRVRPLTAEPRVRVAADAPELTDEMEPGEAAEAKRARM
jgi:hypothetical protein